MWASKPFCIQVAFDLVLLTKTTCFHLSVNIKFLVNSSLIIIFRTFENLCRLYRDPRLPSYQKAFIRATQNVPYIPWIGDLTARLLDKIPTETQTKIKSNLLVISQENYEKSICFNSQKDNANIIGKLLSSLKVWTPIEVNNKPQPNVQAKTVIRKRNGNKLSRPLCLHQDNRTARLKECVELLERHQRAAAMYSIAVNEMARDYLLKARYREDRDNFVCSFSKD